MPNRIHNLDTKIIRNATGEFPAIVMGLDLVDPEQLGPFLDEVVQKFTMQRMMSPPETANLSITISGPLTAKRFCDAWNARAAGNTVLQAFMARMVLAEVQHIQGRELLDRHSLIERA